MGLASWATEKPPHCITQWWVLPTTSAFKSLFQLHLHLLLHLHLQYLQYNCTCMDVALPSGYCLDRPQSLFYVLPPESLVQPSRIGLYYPPPLHLSLSSNCTEFAFAIASMQSLQWCNYNRYCTFIVLFSFFEDISTKQINKRKVLCMQDYVSVLQRTFTEMSKKGLTAARLLICSFFCCSAPVSKAEKVTHLPKKVRDQKKNINFTWTTITKPTHYWHLWQRKCNCIGAW